MLSISTLKYATHTHTDTYTHTDAPYTHTRMPDSTPEDDGTLIEFKAGRMKNADKVVVPDERKGLIFIRQDESQNLHFCWKDRRVRGTELDVVVQPGSVEFHRIESCKTGRIYVLKFRHTSRRMFFWMQDPHHELDDAICARVNELLRSHEDDNPKTVQASQGGELPKQLSRENL